MVIPVLIGFQSFPELLTRSHFASAQTWYYDLYFSDDWSEHWAPFWFELATHRRQKTGAVRRRLQNAPLQNAIQSVPALASSLRNELNGTLGSAYSKIYSELERQIEAFHSPPDAAAPNWLTAA